MIEISKPLSTASVAIWRPVFGAACLALGLATLPASAQSNVDMLEECFFEASDDVPSLNQECGYVVVPESPGAAGASEVRLGFMRLTARSDATEPPLFILAGGPGQTMIAADTLLLFGDWFLGPILEDRDVVILDQRGAPNTVPALDCPSFQSFPWSAYERGLDAAQMDAEGSALLRACVADARASGIDLAHYNSVQIAADVDAARDALGYEQIVFYGASYGAELGQHFMRDFPGSLAAVVLDGASSLSVRSWVEDIVRNVDHATDRLAELCESDAACARAYDIRALLQEAMDLFDEGPIETTYQDPNDPGTVIDLTLTELSLAEMIFEYQTGQIFIHSLPLILSEIVADGRTSAAGILGDVKGSALLASRDATPGGDAMLMHMAVVCSDDPVTAPDDLIVDPDASDYGRAYGVAVLEEYIQLCEAVDVPQLPDETDVDVTVDVPTLILAGALDARTPAIRSAEVAEALPRATLVVFPEGTHVQLGEINLCAGEIMQAFLADPEAVPDTGCIAEMPRRGFALPDGTLSSE